MAKQLTWKYNDVINSDEGINYFTAILSGQVLGDSTRAWQIAVQLLATRKDYFTIVLKFDH